MASRPQQKSDNIFEQFMDRHLSVEKDLPKYSAATAMMSVDRTMMDFQGTLFGTKSEWAIREKNLFLIGAISWQIICNSDAFQSLKLPKGAVFVLVPHHRDDLVRAMETRNTFSLLVYSPAEKTDATKTLSLKISGRDIESGYRRVRELQQSVAKEDFSLARTVAESEYNIERYIRDAKTVQEKVQRYYEMLTGLALRCLTGFIYARKFNPQLEDTKIVVRRMPRIEKVSGYYGQISNSALAVSPINKDSVSTLGVIFQNNGNVFATAARHGFEEDPNKQIANKEVAVATKDGAILLRGQITSDDVITDSCIIRFDDTSTDFIKTRLGKNAFIDRQILADSAPRQNQPAQYNGITTGHRTVKISATQLYPYKSMPTSQSMIITSADIGKGDSGAALYDDDYLLGFAFGRTSFDDQLPAAYWIYADSVFLNNRIYPTAGVMTSTFIS